MLKSRKNIRHFAFVFYSFFCCLIFAPPPVSAQDSSVLAAIPKPELPFLDSNTVKKDTVSSIESPVVVAADSTISFAKIVQIQPDSTVKIAVDSVAGVPTKATITAVTEEKKEEKKPEKKEEKLEKKEKRNLAAAPPANFVILRNARQTDSKTRNNGIVYLVDTLKIRELEALLDNNRAYAHHCGQQWSLSFWLNSSEKADELSINPECEQFERNTKQINANVKEIAAKIDGGGAPHYLYNFKISSAFPPDLIESELAEHFQLLFMGGRFQHLPSVTFRVVENTPIKEKMSDADIEKVVKRNRAHGRDKIEAVVEAVKSKFKVEATGKILNPISGADDKAVEDAFDVTLKFNKDANLEAIANYINENGGNTIDKRIPDFYYIQAISPQKSLLVVRDFIAQRFEYVREVYDYPNKK